MTTSEGEGTQSGAEGAQSGAGENAKDVKDGGTKETSSKAEGTQSGAEETVSKADLVKQQERTRAADERAAKVEAELKKLRDKDLPEHEKLARDYEEATKTVEALRVTNAQLALDNAFLSDNSYEWQNPKRALQLIDRSQVTIEDDGTVSGMKDALKALATSDPYLLKPKTEKEPEKPGSTAPGNNGNTAATKPNVKQMVSRIPALGTRVNRG